MRDTQVLKACQEHLAYRAPVALTPDLLGPVVFLVQVENQETQGFQESQDSLAFQVNKDREETQEKPASADFLDLQVFQARVESMAFLVAKVSLEAQDFQGCRVEMGSQVKRGPMGKSLMLLLALLVIPDCLDCRGIKEKVEVLETRVTRE